MVQYEPTPHGGYIADGVLRAAYAKFKDGHFGSALCSRYTGNTVYDGGFYPKSTRIGPYS